MVRDPFADDEDPDLQTVLDALDDPDCRKIVGVLSEPMTAEEISEAADIPLSTTYRKLDRLTEASLLEEGVELRSDGQHASRYVVAFDEVSIGLSEDREFGVDISRRPDHVSVAQGVPPDPGQVARRARGRLRYHHARHARRRCGRPAAGRRLPARPARRECADHARVRRHRLLAVHDGVTALDLWWGPVRGTRGSPPRAAPR
ncbi:hypothetical protein BRD19_08210 [Halobacteriales archaeon SW_7_65_23]|nr:MAG: hypothetical protein BRD19_08210 [Halobacteriales archaeon SW_7_65_23]